MATADEKAEAAAIRFIEEYCGLGLTTHADTTEIHVGRFPVYMNYGPVTALVITDDISGEVKTEDTYWQFGERGRIIPLMVISNSIWSCCYTYGHAVVPNGLQHCVDMLKADLLADTGLLASETLGDYSYTLMSATEKLARPYYTVLDTYTRCVV